MKVQIHNVTGWDIVSKKFPPDKDSEGFELRQIIIKSDNEILKIDMFLEREKEND